jgi:hypothetical protein
VALHGEPGRHDPGRLHRGSCSRPAAHPHRSCLSDIRFSGARHMMSTLRRWFACLPPLQLRTAAVSTLAGWRRIWHRRQPEPIKPCRRGVSTPPSSSSSVQMMRRGSRDAHGFRRRCRGPDLLQRRRAVSELLPASKGRNPDATARGDAHGIPAVMLDDPANGSPPGSGNVTALSAHSRSDRRIAGTCQTRPSSICLRQQRGRSLPCLRGVCWSFGL